MNYTLNGKEYTLRPWQKDCYEKHFADTHKILLCVGTGLGKTLMSLILASRYKGKILVICIKKKKKDWIRDTEGMGAYVMTRDDIKTQPIPDDVVCIIQDEIHEIVSNTDSGRFDVLHEYIKDKMDIPHILLSATPIRSSWKSVLAIYILLGLAKISDLTKWRNTFQYLGEQWVKRKNKSGGLSPVKIRCYKDKKDDETMAKLQRGIDKISYIYFEDNPNAKHHEVKVPITMEFPITDTEPTAHDFYRLENRHPNKVEKLKELVVPWAIIVCFYSEEVEFLKNLFNCNAVSGKYEYHYGLIDEPIIICQMQSATGFELPKHKRMVFFSYSYGIVPFVQTKGRIDRGDMPDIDYYYMETYYTDSREKTMDYNIRKSLHEGKDYDPATWKKPSL